MFRVVAVAFFVAICSFTYGQNSQNDEHFLNFDAKLLSIIQSVLSGEPGGLVNYSWTVLHSVRDDYSRCDSSECLEVNDFFYLINQNSVTRQPCKVDLILSMTDQSRRGHSAFSGENGILENCESDKPTSARLNFLDQINETTVKCREFVVTPIRIGGKPEEESFCWEKLKDLSEIADANTTKQTFDRACNEDDLVHWRVNDAPYANCNGATATGYRAPPESGQGTASGIH